MLYQSEKIEASFLKTTINKCVTYYRDLFDNKITSLFRRDEVPDMIIKYIMLGYGGKLYYNSFSKLVGDIIDKHKNDKNLLFISNEEFLKFFDMFIEALFINTPNIIKIMLKIIYNSVAEIFKPDKNNYSPLYTILIFNFFISPKMQDLYEISSVKHTIVRNLNRLIRVSITK